MRSREDRKRDLLAAFRKGAVWPEACRVAGVSERTIRRWCEADPTFNEEIDAARDEPLADVESATYRQAIDPDPANNTLRMFYLKCRSPEVWNDKANEPHPAPALPSLPAEAVAEFFAAIRKATGASQPDTR